MRVTFGTNTYDGHYDQYRVFIPEPPSTASAVSWDDYVELLRHAARIPRHPSEKETCTPWSSPMVLGDAGHRCLSNVIGMSCFIGGDLDTAGWTLARVRERLAGLRCIIHTTTKSCPEHPRFRAIVALDREHSLAEYVAVWAALNRLLDDELDQRTDNANRILYFPAAWEGADNQFIVCDGDGLSVDACVNWYGALPVVVAHAFDSIAALQGERAAPDHVAICTPSMVARFGAAKPGGRFWNLLIGAATRYRREGWSLTASDLFAAACDVSRHCQTKRSIREAERALAWVQDHIEPMTALERLRNRLNYQLRHSTKKDHF